MSERASESAEAKRVMAFVDTVDGAREVQRRHQFFVWSQGSFQTLLPHALAICGHYDRHRKEVRLEAFNSVVVSAPLLSTLTDGQSALTQHLINLWMFGHGRALAVDVSTLCHRSVVESASQLVDCDFNSLLIHGVARPQRLNEIETIFIFATAAHDACGARLRELELMLPHLHATYLRVQAVEQEIGAASFRPSEQEVGFSGAGISERECQVLRCAREGLTNQAIAAQLGISALTVKNHIQKILHKLGAANRAQAVARAMAMNLLSGDAGKLNASGPSGRLSKRTAHA